MGKEKLYDGDLMTTTNETPNKETSQPGLDELISLQEAAELSGLSTSHLRLLVSRGNMWGIKLSRSWFTTAKAVQEYVAQGHRPGPKPKNPRK